MVKIIHGNEPITVEHPAFCVFGQPGICKTSLAYTAKAPLLLDFDHGAHRAVGRKDTLAISGWGDVLEIMDARSALDPYATIVVDTVGRCLDLMTDFIIEKNPRLARDGALTQQGWGKLKTDFRTWMARLRGMGKDVVLLAHHREDKDGDVTMVRPDIQGGSFGEVMKTADFVAFLYMQGRERVLDFNPTDRWFGKNPAGWSPFKVPPAAKADGFLAGLIDQGREALGQISAESAKQQTVVEDWRAQIGTFTTAEECNRAAGEIKKLQPTAIAAQAAKLLLDHAKTKGITFDSKSKTFSDPPESKPEPETAASLLG